MSHESEVQRLSLRVARLQVSQAHWPLMRIVLSFLFAVLWLLVVPKVYGDVGISPLIKELTVSRGGRQVFHLVLNNHGSETVSMEIFPADMDVSDAGVPFPATEGYERGCADWLTFTPKEFTLDPKSLQQVRVTVKAPKDAIGSYFALLRCEGTVRKTLDIPIGEKASTGLEFSTAAASLLLTTVTSSRNRVILRPDTVSLHPGRDIGAPPPAQAAGPGGGHWKVEVPVANDGNVYTIVQGQASIWTESGRLMGRAPLVAGRGFVLPERRRIFSGTGDRAIMDGIYLLKVSMRSREGKTLGNSLPFIVNGGMAEFGIGSEEVRDLLRATSPGFIVNHPFKELSITPGGRSYGAVVLNNVVADTLHILPWVTGWIMDENGELIIGHEATTHPRSCANWIKLEQTSIDLPAKRNKAFKFSLEAPQDASGAYYAAIVFDRDVVRKDLPTELVAQRAQLIAAVARKGLTYAMEIDSIKIRKIKPDTYEFSFKLRNTGTGRCYVDGELQLFGETAWDLYKEVGEPEKLADPAEWIMPASERVIKIECPALPKGRYEAKVTVTYDPEHEPKVFYQRFTLR